MLPQFLLDLQRMPNPWSIVVLVSRLSFYTFPDHRKSYLIVLHEQILCTLFCSAYTKLGSLINFDC